MACWALKYFWLNLTTSITSTRETGRMSSAIRAILGLMDSIMMSTPTIVATLVISCVTLWFRLWPSVIHVVCDAGQHLADGALFKVGQRQAVDLFC